MNALLLFMALVVIFFLVLLLLKMGSGRTGDLGPIRPIPARPLGHGDAQLHCQVGAGCLYPQDFYVETYRVQNGTVTFSECREWCWRNTNRTKGKIYGINVNCLTEPGGRIAK